jgi:hypothetical protein
MDCVGHYWPGKHHRPVKGINLITLYYTDIQGRHQPINFRVYDKAEGKTKNDYFQDMLVEALSWGVKPAFVTGDSWYSCVSNLKRVKKHQMGLLFGLESNRLVSVEKSVWVQVQTLAIPEEGLEVWLKSFGKIKVFRTYLKNQARHYAVALPDEEPLTSFRLVQFTGLHDKHWQIEQYHRAIKQACNIERFQVRSKIAITNHLFAAICGYVQLQKLSTMSVINNCYGLRRELFDGVIAEFVKFIMPKMAHLNSEFTRPVNA